MTVGATTDTLACGLAFAEAYAAGDEVRLETLLAPDVRQREIAPGEIVKLRGAPEVLREAREFLAAYDSHETLAVDVERVGERVRAGTRWRLRRGDDAWIVEWWEFLTVDDGRISAIDVVCSGAVREAGAGAA
ncbi:MAG: nuclear transport factor 2 family protein [Thermoleophilaceae bacterium]